ncbi:DUF3800 domain-containing protein [Phenylobacterium sp.]|uniref:DUF3800 domain-containing protein n=1 Tax=Phenylobacterium sp. TaxID=1871053 RepID=UPI0025CCA021|nr:DUF3800 domain-containing protein [Phenylobacterium sp.]MCA3740692.1 DUF3800 domain-containing protein [Phenylobacterium sp.]
MPDKFIFADEAGCFTFERKLGASKHFILCTIAADSCDVGMDLIALRRELAWAKVPMGDYFHACNDSQTVRDAVFQRIADHKFSIQATVMEKTKAQPHIRADRPQFYKTGWYFHFRHGAARQLSQRDEVLITTASIGNKRERLSFQSAVDDVMQQTVKVKKWATDFWPAGSDPCLQVADYCAWAIQRKWERGDVRSYNLIKDRITYEYDLWARGTEHHY